MLPGYRRSFHHLEATLEARPARLSAPGIWRLSELTEALKSVPLPCSLGNSDPDAMDGSTKTTVLQILDLRVEADYSAILFGLGDASASDPEFVNFETGERRVSPIETDEGLSYGAHMVLSHEAVEGRYSVVWERAHVPRGQAVRFINQLFRESHELKRKVDSKTIHPVVELRGKPDKRLEDGLRDGRLHSLVLVKNGCPDDFGPFESGLIAEAQEVHFKVMKKRPSGFSSLAAFKKMLPRARELGAARMRVVFTDDEKHRTTVEVSTEEEANSLYVRSTTENFSAKLRQCPDGIDQRIIDKMRGLL